MLPEEIEARVLYRDGLMLVINKPAGIPVHKGKGGGENLEDYLDTLRYGLPRKPMLAHRLDKETSGCLVLGRHPKAITKLGKLFSSGKIEKTYWAVVQGSMPEREGSIDLPLAKASERKDQWHMKVDEAGLPSRTDYRVLGEADGKSWVELKPITGRTHQLRVHCAAIGCPILGEYIYATDPATPRLYLHARAVLIPISHNKPPVLVTAPPPEHMQEWLSQQQLAI